MSLLTYHKAKSVVEKTIFCTFFMSDKGNARRISIKEENEKDGKEENENKDEKEEKPIEDIYDFINDRAIFLENNLSDKQLRFFIDFSMNCGVSHNKSFENAFKECGYNHEPLEDEEYEEENDGNILNDMFPFLSELGDIEKYDKFVVEFTKKLLKGLYPDIKFVTYKSSAVRRKRN